MGSSLLVAFSVDRVLGLVNLVAQSITSSVGSSAEADIRVLSDVLVGLFGTTRDGFVSLVTDVLGGVPEMQVSSCREWQCYKLKHT